MRFVAVLTLLVAAVTALPADQDGNGHSLEKRRTCAEAFPNGCAGPCCKEVGGCSFMNCAQSYCKYFNVGQPECVCKCHYG